MLDRLGFLFGEAIMALRRNRLMTVAAVSTVAVSLFLIGGLGIAYLRISDYAQTLPGKFDMRVMLKDGLKFDEIKANADKIRTFAGVRTVQWIPRDVAWKKWKQEHPDLVLEDIENPLPDALKVVLTDLDHSAEVAAKIQMLTAVEPNGVTYLSSLHTFLAQLQRLVRWMGLTIGGLLFLTAGILIFNTIKLGVHARRREIRIMQLVGATRLTIQLPFILEGLFHGILGGVLATIALQSAHRLLTNAISNWQALPQPESLPTLTLALALCTIGACYGVLCSLLAVWDPMRTQL